MTEIIMGTLVAFFVIIGVTEFFHTMGDFLFKPPSGRVRFFVTSCGHDEQLEYMIRSVAHRAPSFLPADRKPLIIVVDNGMDEETKKICSLLSEELGCVEICRSEELPDKFRGDFQT